MNLFTEVKEGLWIAWDAIRANKLRSILTTLGIVIGVVTVTLMGTAIDGLNRAFLRSISMLGTDVLYVSRISWFVDSYEEWLKVRDRRDITLAQVRELEKQMTLARAIAPIVDARRPVKYKNRNSTRVTIIGTSEQIQFTSGSSVAQGRYMTAEEADGGRPVCVIGSEVATNLFQNEPALGRKIKVGLQAFEVIGVLGKQGNFLGQFSLDNQVIIPVLQFLIGIWHDPYLEIHVT